MIRIIDSQRCLSQITPLGVLWRTRTWIDIASSQRYSSLGPSGHCHRYIVTLFGTLFRSTILQQNFPQNQVMSPTLYLGFTSICCHLIVKCAYGPDSFDDEIVEAQRSFWRQNELLIRVFWSNTTKINLNIVEFGKTKPRILVSK